MLLWGADGDIYSRQERKQVGRESSGLMSCWPEGSCGEKPCLPGKPHAGWPWSWPCCPLTGAAEGGGGWDRGQVSEATRSRRPVTGVPYCYPIMSALGGGGRADASGHLQGATSAGYSAKCNHFGIVEAGYQPRQAVCSYIIVCTQSVRKGWSQGQQDGTWKPAL